ncbi:putative acetoacetyl-CoA synthetase [Violaceomyces palustris]|uniref:Acetoacetyl-CoA synthetase n=1 Tax=Violaceomyces palustris TaxID=1673888 RepID=A0ACD0NXJ7_9BASI|nr:putative acetoacetyl-CoA synthetase [Violaceomyces palustris]
MASTNQLQGSIVWEPSKPEETRMERFRKRINEDFKLRLEDYHQLWRWSCENPSEFWQSVWDETGVISSQKAEQALPKGAPIYPPPKWFQGSRLNFAENLLRHKDSDRVALIESTEVDTKTGKLAERSVTYRELNQQVSKVARALRKRGVKVNDCVASYSSNCIDNLVAFLACSSIGAVWTSAAADFGPEGVLERLRTVRPKVLFSVNAVRYNGKVHDHVAKLAAVVEGLEKDRPKDEQALEAVVVIPYVDDHPAPHEFGGGLWQTWQGLMDEGQAPDDRIEFEQLDFNHPLWILFSSGTTGKPKAITHRAGGMLIQLSKEHMIHGGMTEDDVFFQHTTTGWMMWNFLIAGLVTGATLVLYDGSPLKPPGVLWDLAEKHGVTVFGTSAAYLGALEKSGYVPKENHKLKVKQILSTGSPLRAELYPFILEKIGSDILIGSVTGGTDLCSLFAGHNVCLPVRAGEIQARNLGMDMDVFDDHGRPVARGEEGDLVCKTPFPAQPLGFWKQPEQKYFESYYSQFPGVWYHGDYVSLSQSGGLVMLGRSDGILNPGGIRFGSSEIYELLESNAEATTGGGGEGGGGGLEDVVDSLVVALKTPKGDDEAVVLFLVVRPGSKSDASEQGFNELSKRIADLVRTKRSARHVPKFCRKVHGCPKTLNGKRVEVPVKKLINGADLSTINLATLSNPECLDEYVRLGRELREELATHFT